MPKFSYQAINESGKTVTGVLEADSSETATDRLVAQGYIPSKITKKEEGSEENLWSGIQERLTKVKAADLILFTKQFRTMIRSGVPIMTLLQVMDNQTENLKLKKVVISMTQDIKGGRSIYDAFKKHPSVFSNLYCSMVRAGESSGALPEVLNRLIYIIEHEDKVKSEVKSALQYPIIVIIFLAIAFFVLLTFVVPKFVKIFESANLALPIPTKICILMYNILNSYWFMVLGVLVAGIAALVLFLKTEQGQYTKDKFIMKVPIVGPLVVKSVMSRFASIFAILQSSGVSILDSIEILSGTIGNVAITREFDRIQHLVKEGRGISGPLNAAKFFTPMVINMVAIGEESGNLDEMLGEVATHYDGEVEYATKRLSELIGPLLTVGLAAVVGFFALSIFLPMWDLTQMVK